jgi:hypothetical protein
MWTLTAPITILTLTSTDLLGKLINVTLSGLTTTFVYMSASNENTTIKNYYDDLEDLDIQLKLSLINNWIKKTEYEIKDPNFELIYNAISDSCNKINMCVCQINSKIEYHYSKWFHLWRNLDLYNEIKIIKKQTKILDNRLILINLKNNI